MTHEVESEDERVSTTKEEPGAEQYWKALKLFRSETATDLAAGRTALQEAAAREFTHAQLLLGECFESGSYGFTKNKSKAAAYFRLAAERGNAFAKLSYGLCLFSGFGVRGNEKKAMEWLLAALAENADYSIPSPPAKWQSSPAEGADKIAGTLFNDPVASAKVRAHFALALIAERQKKPAEAQQHYVEAAIAGPGGRSGLQEAALQAALNFAFGRGVPRDPAKAEEMLRAARTLVRQDRISLVHNFAEAKLVDDFAVSEMEEAVAEVSDDLAADLEVDIARQFTDRKSKDYNPKEAVKWYELAAENGKAWAMLELAFLYSGTDLGPPNTEKALGWFEKAGGGDSPKHLLGVANLVICYQNGIGTMKNSAKALEIANKHRDRDIVCYLAGIGQCPTSTVTYREELELNRKWGKEKKDAFAQYLLGLRYERGWGVESDINQAVYWYQKAAKAHCGPASYKLGWIYENAFIAVGLSRAGALPKAVACYRAAAEVKDAAGLAALGLLYQDGVGVPKDLGLAQSLYEESLRINPNGAMALNNLGVIFGERFDEAIHTEQEPKYRDLMLRYYEQASQKGEAVASRNLAWLYAKGRLGVVDWKKAYEYFEKAADLGDTLSRFQLGDMHERGLGVPITLAEAAYHYRLAALDGHTEALIRLAKFYLEGKGGARDFERAQFWLKLLIDQGHTGALMAYIDVALAREKHAEVLDLLFELKDVEDRKLSGFAYERLARCYAHGVGVKAKLSRANAFREKAVALGNADAIFSLGLQKIMDKEEQAGVALFLKAADGGSAEAAFALGKMYYHGQMVSRDFIKALSYLRKAAGQNHAGALYFLAALTFNRVDGAPPLEEAIDFVRQAESLGNKEAVRLREELERRRTPFEPSQETAAPRSA